MFYFDIVKDNFLGILRVIMDGFNFMDLGGGKG